MSIILKGINLAEMGENRRIVIYDNGHVVVKEEGWDEDGYNKHYRTIYDVQAIQIPKDHGRIGDLDELQKAIRTDIMGGLNYEHFIRNAPTILEAEGEDVHKSNV